MMIKEQCRKRRDNIRKYFKYISGGIDIFSNTIQCKMRK